MAGPITDAHKLKYKENVELAVQQKRSKLDMAFSYVSDLAGRIAQMVELIGSTTAVTNLGRKADTPDIDNTVEPIWIQPAQLAWGKLMELEDAIKAMSNYQSPFIQAGAAAMVRGKDVILRDAIFGTRRIGQDGASTSSWNGSTVAVTVGSPVGAPVATGMNVKKIMRARRYLQAAQIDTGTEQLFLATNAQGIEELFSDEFFVNSDYRTKKVLDQPEDIGILGVTVLPPLDGAAALADYDADTFTGALWAKSGLHWGEFDPLRTDVPLRPDKMNRPHPHMEHWLGASRSEDVKVVKILNDKV